MYKMTYMHALWLELNQENPTAVEMDELCDHCTSIVQHTLFLAALASKYIVQKCPKTQISKIQITVLWKLKGTKNPMLWKLRGTKNPI